MCLWPGFSALTNQIKARSAGEGASTATSNPFQLRRSRRSHWAMFTDSTGTTGRRVGPARAVPPDDDAVPQARPVPCPDMLASPCVRLK
jgi:hypothetical protein